MTEVWKLSRTTKGQPTELLEFNNETDLVGLLAEELVGDNSIDNLGDISQNPRTLTTRNGTTLKFWREDTEDEARAKTAWEALNPDEDTIEWYDRFFADIQDIGVPTANPRYYRTLMKTLAEYQKEREEFGDDDGWLSVMREQYEAGLSDTDLPSRGE